MCSLRIMVQPFGESSRRAAALKTGLRVPFGATPSAAHLTSSNRSVGVLANSCYLAVLTRKQGNRVSWSLGDEADEEVVVPSGDFALEAHGVFGR